MPTKCNPAAKLDRLIQLRAPRWLIVAVRKAARSQGLNSSQYVRLSVAERLHRDADAAGA